MATSVKCHWFFHFVQQHSPFLCYDKNNVFTNFTYDRIVTMAQYALLPHLIWDIETVFFALSCARWTEQLLFTYVYSFPFLYGGSFLVAILEMIFMPLHFHCRRYSTFLLVHCSRSSSLSIIIAIVALLFLSLSSSFYQFVAVFVTLCYPRCKAKANFTVSISFI